VRTLVPPELGDFSGVDPPLALFPTSATSTTKSLQSWFRTVSPLKRSAFRSSSGGVFGCSMMRKIALGSETAKAQALALPPS